MTVKYTVRNAPLQGGENYEKIANELTKDIFANQEKLSKEVNDAIVGRLTLSQEFVNRLNLVYGDSRWGDFLGVLKPGTKDQVRDQLNNIETRLGTVLANNLEVDHVDITYVNTRTAILINLLQGAVLELQSGFPEEETYRFLGQVGGGTRDIKTINSIINSLQKNLAFSERLSDKLEGVQTGKASQDMRGYIDEVLRELEEEVVVEIDKQKYIDALDSTKPLGKFALKTRNFNTNVKGRIQGALGKGRNAALRNYDQTLKNNEKKFLEKIEKAAFSVKGSPRIDETLLSQLEANFMNRKAKIAKSASKITKRSKPKVNSRTKQKKAKFDNKAAEFKRLVAGAQARATLGTRTKRQDSNAQRSLNQLRITINKMLPAKIQENMGRPRLEYRSGRFANSVRLETLTQGPKTVIGQYSYMENPYATFENSDRWPSGYNPKPLITESIRELATKKVAQKFTIRKL